MKVTLLVFLVLASLAGCASSPDYLSSLPEASAEEKSAAQDSLIRCVEAYTKTLDDGVSPANLIAESVARSCRDPFATMYKTQTQGQPVNVRNGFTGVDWERTKVRMTTSMILSIRAREKNKSK